MFTRGGIRAFAQVQEVTLPVLEFLEEIGSILLCNVGNLAARLWQRGVLRLLDVAHQTPVVSYSTTGIVQTKPLRRCRTSKEALAFDVARDGGQEVGSSRQ